MSTKLRWVRARNLFSVGRMDFVVKERFFHSLLTGIGRDETTDLYYRHILLRTNGHEPADFLGVPSPKGSLESYLRSSVDLLTSLRLHAYDPAQPVPIGRNGLPLNGAHRIACAMALGLDVVVEDYDRDGGLWDLPWFERAGFSKVDRLEILHRLVEVIPERSVVFVMWGPVIDYWDQISSALAAKIPMVGSVDLAWPAAEQAAFESLVYDTYSLVVASLAQGFGPIDRKLGFLRQKPSFIRVGVCFVPPEDAHTVFGRVPAIKAELRELAKDAAPVDQFVTCHLSDSAAESLHMAHTLLSPRNLAVARLRPTAKPRGEFLEWLDNYRRVLTAQQLNPEDCCIVGSGVLEPIGVRLATDIDFTVRKAIRTARYGPGVTKLEGGVDIVTEGYHRLRDGRAFTDDQIIATPGLHTRFRGLKVAAPFIVRDRKDFSRRPKDCLDVELIDSRLEAVKDPQLKPCRAG